MVAVVFPDWAKQAAVAAFRDKRPHALPSVALVQTAFESAWFTKVTGKCNLGGIKATAGHPSTLCWTHEAGSTAAVQCAFRDFASFDEYFAVHGDVMEHSIGCADYRAALDKGASRADAVHLLGGGTAKHPRYATGSAQAYGDALASMLRAHPDLLQLDRL